MIDYIDYEAYGRDVQINEGGHFAPGGYICFENAPAFYGPAAERVRRAEEAVAQGGKGV